MIGDNIKRIRNKKDMSQEELAAGLHVVRQTVSKWEQGLSVPNAEAVIKMAELLDVTVNEILGVETDRTAEELASELKKVNELLEEKNEREHTMILANKKRGYILLLSFAALIISLTFRNQLVSICLAGICMIAATVILYRNLALLTVITTNDLKIRALKITTVFDIAVLLVGITFAVLMGSHVIHISDEHEELFAMALLSCIMIFSGIICPKLPFNRHTGLRLPWTVQDEDTWNVAHKAVGYTALPICLLYIAGTLTMDDFEAVSFAAVAAWIGLPAVISLIYYYRKIHGKL